MRKRLLVLLVAVVMAMTTVATPAFANHSGSYYKDGPWCHWYGHGYEVVWGKAHYYHGDYRAQKYYDYYGNPYYSCGYLYGYPGFGFGVSVDIGL